MKRGDIVRERFRIEQRAGAGGMGQIFQATDLASGNLVAMKLMLNGELQQARRFIREAQLLSSLRHPGIVQFIDDGVTDSGDPYFVMEWLQGEDLSIRLQRGPLPVHDALTLMFQVASALAVAHERGIVHRDLKPSNIFLLNGRINQVKVLDFGIAALIGATPLTRSGVLVGTPAYMAPEQMGTPQRVDARTDVFALGSILMECLTGVPVFRGDHVMAVLAKIVLQESPRLRELLPELSFELEELIACMMAKDPRARPRDGAEVAAIIALLQRMAADGETAESLTVEPPHSLTAEEQRVLSLVLVGHPAPPHGLSLAVDPATMYTSQEALRRTVYIHGGVLTVLADGSAIVTFAGRRENIVDLTAQAAHCALALRVVAPDRPIALSTGRGQVKEELPVGVVIDRAAQMLAECNTIGSSTTLPISIDETSARLLDGRFEIVVGRRSFTLLGLHGQGTRTLLGKATSFVGRDFELRILSEACKECIEESSARAVVIIADAGIGKSRLLKEFLEISRKTAPDLVVWMGRSDSLAAGSALALLGHALQDALGIREGGSLEERQRQIRDRVMRHGCRDDIDRVVEFLGELVGVPFIASAGSQLQAARQDARLMGEQLRSAFEDFLDFETAAHPVLLVLEDLQWGDLPTVRFVDAALRNFHDRPFCVIALARPEVTETFPKLWSDRIVQTIRLPPLSRRASDKLVTQVLGAVVSPETRSRIVTQADGNAFYLEELVRAVADARSADAKAGTVLPETVLAMVQARLDALPAESRRHLRAASVFGESFFRGGLAALVGTAPSSQSLGAVLDDLVAREFIRPQKHHRFAEFTFRHALIREGAYAMLTDSDRRLGHQLAGTWLEEQGEPDPMLLAHHFEHAGDLPRTARAYRRAAEHSLEADDLDAAIERAERGVSCGASGLELGALRLIQAEAHNWRAELVLSERRATEALELLERGTMEWFRALQHAVDAAGNLGASDRVEHWARVAPAAMPHADAMNARTTCLSVCANHLIYGGRYDAADAMISVLTDPTQLATQGAQAVGMYYQLRAIRASASGDLCEMRESLEAALLCFEQAGDRRNACLTRQNLGFALTELGDYETAEKALRSALTIAERMGLHPVTTVALQNLGRVHAYRGAFEEGRRVQKLAIEAARKHEYPRLLGVSHVYLAELELLTGDVKTAELEVRAGLESLSGTPPLRASALGVLARILLARGPVGEALGAASEAHALLESLGSIEEGETAVRLVYAEALAANGLLEEFASALISAREHLLARANRISDPAGRERFLRGIADNARTLELPLPVR